MIEFFLWALLAGYAYGAYRVVRRIKDTVSRSVIAALFILPVAPWAYSQVAFQVRCHQSATEIVRRPVPDVDGVLFSTNWGLEAAWIHWLVDKGGYNYAEYQRGNKVEHIYWTSHPLVPWEMSKSMSQSKPTAQYEIYREVTLADLFIYQNDFIARNRTTGEEFGRKTVLFLEAGVLSRLLYWIVAIDMDAGGYTCPRIRTSDDLLKFFPERVFLPKPRS
jgi:hypothetical protein